MNKEKASGQLAVSQGASNLGKMLMTSRARKNFAASALLGNGDFLYVFEDSSNVGDKSYALKHQRRHGLLTPTFVLATLRAIQY